MDTLNFEYWFNREANNENICFLCGTRLDNTNKTKEHIFPKWILQKFDLWKDPLKLLNDSYFNYRSATIPCCQDCNNNSLSTLEKKIQTGVDKGFDFFVDNVSKASIYKWSQLIFYKILYKEQFLKEDIKSRASNKIVSKQQFEFLRLNHLFLRSIDKNVEFANFFPGSIFTCKLKTSESDYRLNFDYMDSVPEQCFAIRMNDIGIIVMLADSGLQELLKMDEYNQYLSHILAPIQFRNLFAKCLYQQMLFRDPFEYMIESKGADSISIARKNKKNFEGNVYEQGNADDYAELLGSVFNCDANQFRLDNGSTGSLFYDKNGNWKDREFDDNVTIAKTV
jgi:hypothetical protein